MCPTGLSTGRYRRAELIAAVKRAFSPRGFAPPRFGAPSPTRARFSDHGIRHQGTGVVFLLCIQLGLS